MATNLVHLAEVQRLSPLVIRILGGNPGKFTLQGTNTYLIGTGPDRLLLDTGSGHPSYLPLLRKTLSAEKCSISSVLLTHWHEDHIGEVSSLRSLNPSTKVFKSSIRGPSEEYPAIAGEVLDIKDGQYFKTPCGKGTLIAHHTPGHTYDHMSFYLQEESTLFTGDNVLGQGTAVFSNLAMYISSLQKMKGICDGQAFPGHGPVIQDGKAKIAEYLKHRQAREDEILEVIRKRKGENDIHASGCTSMEIVKVVYKDVDEALHIPAEWGVKLVLEKLVGEEKVSRKGNVFVMKDRSSAL